MHKLGIIGYGGMASGYHHENAKRADVDLEALCAYDIDPERRAYAQSRGLEAFDDLDKFLAQDFDLCLVATPNNFHCEMACAALNAGKNVICEKPVAMSSAELQKMIDTAEKNHKLFTVHHNRRWDRDFMIVKQAFDDGTIKQPYMIESRIHSNSGSMQGWRGEPDHGGGMLLDWGIHALDQMLYLVKEPISTVSATIRSVCSTKVDDYAKVIITFESGLAAQVEVATFAIQPLPRWSVYGRDAALTVDAISSEKGKLRIVRNAHTDHCELKAYNHGGDTAHEGIWREHSVEKRYDDYFRCEFVDAIYPQNDLPQDWASLYKNVLAAIDGREELIVKPAEVMRVMRVVEAAFKSDSEHITVKF
ncbi:MAG: Gfo/Idh/MocA family oxidoreductase [Eubacteriales bacterium]